MSSTRRQTSAEGKQRRGHWSAACDRTAARMERMDCGEDGPASGSNHPPKRRARWMEQEPGDDYVRRIAAFIRTNHSRLGQSKHARGHPSTTGYDVWAWVGWSDANKGQPLAYTTDLHHLFYLLMRFEDLAVDVGPLDVRLEAVSRPLSYVSLLAAKDRSDVRSIASVKSAISKFSLGGGWWGRHEPPNVDADLKSIYSAFTILPSISIHQSSLQVIQELAHDPPLDHGVPIYVFKLLQQLECVGTYLHVHFLSIMRHISRY
jgi:hypothetical protein